VLYSSLSLSSVPRVNIVTDIICGFPTETEEDFQETLSLVDKYKFSSLFINQFYPRPGTPAAKMKKLPTHVVKRRSKELTELFHSYSTYENRVGTSETILITDISHDRQYYVGHTKYYEQVLVEQREGLMGKSAEVTIKSCGKHYMMGELMATPTVQPHPRPSMIKSPLFEARTLLLIIVLMITLLVTIYRLPHITTVLHKIIHNYDLEINYDIDSK
jgi:threonylcarbamoyladenosine tRNA methylthiotransferase CDKAL1